MCADGGAWHAGGEKVVAPAARVWKPSQTWEAFSVSVLRSSLLQTGELALM